MTLKAYLIIAALVSYIGVALYAAHIGSELCTSKESKILIKEVNQDEKVKQATGRMAAPELDRALDYWMRD